MSVKRSHFIGNQKGVAVLEALIAAVVLATLIVCAGATIRAYAGFQVHRVVEGNIEALRTRLRDVLSCERTVEEANIQALCDAPGGNFVPGLKLDGTEIISNFDPLAVSDGRYSLRLLCRTFPSESNLYEIVPQFAIDHRVIQEEPYVAGYFTDPFNKKQYEWSPLFHSPLVCAKTPGGPSVDLKGKIASGTPGDGPFSIAGGEEIQLSWTSANVTSCTLTPGSSTELNHAGLGSGPLISTTLFTINCDGPAGTATDTLLVNVDQTCSPGITRDILTFEDFDEGAYIDASVNAQLSTDYGVTFTSGNGGDLRVAKIVGESEPEPFYFAWLSILCPKRPNHNRICRGGAADVGRRALSTENALSTKDISFEISYAEPVQGVSFDILDLDGKENWTFSAFDEFNAPIVPVTVAGGGGYGGGTGNNAVTKFSMSAPGLSIRRLRFVGQKSIKLFGFAFDNFRTGLKACP